MNNHGGKRVGSGGKKGILTLAQRCSRSSAIWNKEKRMAVMKILGNKCSKCGFKDFRALQIDHVNGDGASDGNTRGSTFCLRVIESVRIGEKRYQILCANCNWIKRCEKKEYKPRGKRII